MKLRYTDTHKECSACREMLPHDHFGPSVGPKSPWHGLRAKCHRCEAGIKRTKDRAKGVKPRPVTVVTESEKSCTDCGRTLPHSAFGSNPTAGHGLTAACKECRRWQQLAKMYGISAEEYNELFEEQGGLCAICCESFPDPLHVDHNHHTGEIRSLLCHGCNTAIGLLRDDPNLCRAAADYLECHA